MPQKIVLGNAQDDPGLFLTAINDNLGDPRYLPFEGAGRDQFVASGAAGRDQRDRPGPCRTSSCACITAALMAVTLQAGGRGRQRRERAECRCDRPQREEGIPRLGLAAVPRAAGGGRRSDAHVERLALQVPKLVPGEDDHDQQPDRACPPGHPGNFVLRPIRRCRRRRLRWRRSRDDLRAERRVGRRSRHRRARPGTWSFKLRTAARGRQLPIADARGVGDVLLMIAFQAA